MLFPFHTLDGNVIYLEINKNIKNKKDLINENKNQLIGFLINNGYIGIDKQDYLNSRSLNKILDFVHAGARLNSINLNYLKKQEQGTLIVKPHLLESNNNNKRKIKFPFYTHDGQKVDLVLSPSTRSKHNLILENLDKLNNFLVKKGYTTKHLTANQLVKSLKFVCGGQILNSLNYDQLKHEESGALIININKNNNKVNNKKNTLNHNVVENIKYNIVHLNMLLSDKMNQFHHSNGPNIYSKSHGELVKILKKGPVYLETNSNAQTKLQNILYPLREHVMDHLNVKGEELLAHIDNILDSFDMVPKKSYNSIVKPLLMSGGKSQFIHIPGKGKRKVRYQKNGRAYVIVNKKKLKL